MTPSNKWLIRILVGLLFGAPLKTSQAQPATGAKWPKVASAQVNSSTKSLAYQQVLEQRQQAYANMKRRYWDWQSEVVKKGKHYPRNLHAWLAECSDIYEKLGDAEAEEYCKLRKMQIQKGKIKAAIQAGKIGEKKKKKLKALGLEFEANPHALGPVARIPFKAIKELVGAEGIEFIRPIPPPDEKMRKKAYFAAVKQAREELQALYAQARKARRVTEELRKKMKRAESKVASEGMWFSPRQGRELPVVRGKIALNFRPGVDREMAEQILHSYGCWILRYNPTRAYAHYIVHCQDRGDSGMEDLLRWLGHDPDIIFLEPEGTVELE